VQIVEGIPEDVSVGQVVWAPRVTAPSPNLAQTRVEKTLVFVGWSCFSSNFNTPRKLGMVYCHNKPCFLYAVEAPVPDRDRSIPAASAVKLTEGISSALFPRFSPSGKLLVFLSSQAAVSSGVHTATSSLHSISWPVDRGLSSPMEIKDVVKVVQHADNDNFPGLYCTDLIANPWLADSSIMFMSSIWRSQEVILAVDVESGDVSRVSPTNSLSSWKLLGLQSSSLLAGNYFS
jgi:acylaminoacyl-peptidase